MLDIVGKRYWYFLISLIVIIPGVVSLILYGLPLAIDFTGGSLLEIQFPEAENLQPAEVKEIFGQFGFDDSIVQTSGEGQVQDTILVRTKSMDNPTKEKIEAALEDRYGSFVEQRFESVGPSVGTEVAQRASWAVVASAIAILAYIAFAFRHVPSPFRYGVCAIVAMVHDVLVVIGLASIFGQVFGWEVDALFLTALLTIIGFSVHDSIVVFDRIRENLIRHRGESFEAIVNHSILQTLDRSINTQLTVMFTLLALTLFGGVTIKHFVITMLIGIFSGTYSSIFNAAPLLVVWENGEIGRFFRRVFGRQAEVAT
jgi:preprotein translocase subunit SecF